MINITDKKISVYLKQGWTLADFANYYNVSEEKFLDHIEKNFTPKAFKNIKMRLAKNEKKNKHRTILQAQDDSEPEEEIVNAEIESESNKSNIEIEALTSHINYVSNQICEQELRHKELVSKR